MKSLKIGLALGAGAAKGWSHIGVINALRRMGIEADIIVGCSAGALVGSALACQRLDALEQWVRSFSYWDVLRLMDLSWQRGGLLRGERVFKAIDQLIGTEKIEDCKLKFGAVATNLSTGRELWFTDGDLHRAVRASCSMPGLLSPVPYEGDWLIDGAIVNPVPVSLARAMGADIVIAVDLHDDHLTSQKVMPARTGSEEPSRRPWGNRLRERLVARKESLAPTAIDIMATSIQLLEVHLTRSRLASEPADIVLRPPCSQIAVLDFHRAAETIAAGEIAVANEVDALRSLIKK